MESRDRPIHATSGTAIGGRFSSEYSRPDLDPVRFVTERTQSCDIGAKTIARTASAPAVTHQPRCRIPISAKGASVGLMSTSAAGQPQRVPAATAATIQMVGVPET